MPCLLTWVVPAFIKDLPGLNVLSAGSVSDATTTSTVKATSRRCHSLSYRSSQRYFWKNQVKIWMLASPIHFEYGGEHTVKAGLKSRESSKASYCLPGV